MTEAPAKKQNLIQKLQEKIPDKDEQFEYIGLVVRLLLLLWATAMLSFSYLDLSKLGIPQQKIDPTFIASIFVSISASFGANIQQKGDKNGSSNGKSVKADLKEALGDIELIGFKHKVELVPVKTKIDPISGKEIDLQSGRLKP
tara:strand:+ start:240 stop:671 length:432 start_codon:yes stop_codon:yes gene_type:complete